MAELPQRVIYIDRIEITVFNFVNTFLDWYVFSMYISIHYVISVTMTLLLSNCIVLFFTSKHQDTVIVCLQWLIKQILIDLDIKLS